MEKKFYVLKYPTGELVGLDDASGGYPYPTDGFYGVEQFPSAEAADRYRQMSDNREGFTIHSATLTLATEPVEG